MFFYVCGLILHRCVQKIIHNNRGYRKKNDKSLYTFKKGANDYFPIRIMFDFELIYNSDKFMCYEPEQDISWLLGTYTCSESDILTEQKIHVLEDSLNNINDYLSSLIQVPRTNNKITTNVIEDILISEKTYSTIDLHISVVSRPFGDSNRNQTVAASLFDQTSPVTNRPITAGLYINPSAIPNISQNYNSMHREFFTGILHECFHILGINEEAYPLWIHRKTGLPYGSSLPLNDYSKENEYPNKVFTVLHTPLLRKFFNQRFNHRRISKSIPPGLILEDYNSDISHPKGSIYMHELMTTNSIHPISISDLSLTLLEATGWYTCNFSMAEPLLWGVNSSINGSPPSLSIPSDYMCDERQSLSNITISYDYSGPAVCSKIVHDVNCNETFNENEKIFCQSQLFYDPNKTNSRGLKPSLDFIHHKIPILEQSCLYTENNLKNHYGEYYGIDSICTHSTLNQTDHYPRCYKMECTDNNTKLFIFYGNESLLCKYDGYNLEFENKTVSIECPPLEMICTILSYRNTTFTEPQRESTAKYPPQLILIIAVSVVICGVGIVILVSILITKHIQRNKDLNDADILSIASGFESSNSVRVVLLEEQ
ncbi:hypothetical protein TRFO_09983 [Tritrichomonas foetus]|uniref:GP63-like n=1 Tax=Tritrichomonas foetus TaxID=1144522 RepID=A0A1J4JAX6_9EUKA|nr:hypothetical protein TRFO_09983 [Tritrichomonas foetus]|eukprot:OHS96338.1 hypothetical protein TRFO_09983 [Tritrichomonas foetus]